MLRKKAFSVFMIVAVAVGMIIVPAVTAGAAEAASDSPYSVTVLADRSSVKPGDTVTISLDITSNDPEVTAFNDAEWNGQ